MWKTTLTLYHRHHLRHMRGLQCRHLCSTQLVGFANCQTSDAAGLFLTCNRLGAGGGRPTSAHMVQIVNSTLCAVWFFSASFGGSILNLLGPGITMCVGVLFYVVYVGALWYFDEVGKIGYPIASGVIIGIGSGMVFITAGYIQTSYPEEREKGLYITTQLNLQALGSIIGGIIPVIINRNSATSAGVPRAVYIAVSGRFDQDFDFGS